jgi:hypothetical protein
VTNNVFYINRPLARKYDLKGASYGRYVKEDQDQEQQGQGRGGEDLDGGGGAGGGGGVESSSSSSSLVLKEHNFSARGLVRESRGEYMYPERSNKLSVGKI